MFDKPYNLNPRPERNSCLPEEPRAGIKRPEENLGVDHAHLLEHPGPAGQDQSLAP